MITHPQKYRRPCGLRGVFLYSCVLGLSLSAGCATDNVGVQSQRPWDQPTKAELSSGWWWLPNQDTRIGDHYP